MKKSVLAILSLTALTALLATGCPPAEGEGEGEGDAAEGEGDVAEGEGDVAEGEGDVVGEGEGDVVGEGEGEPPPAEFTSCQPTCATDADCTDPNPADDLAVACDNTNNTCVFELPAGGGCTTDLECVALFNGIQSCTTVTECPGGGAGFKCATFEINAESFTGCALDATDIGAGPQCFFGTLTAATDEDAAGAAIQVCVNVTAGTEDSSCDAGVCTNPCAIDADCPPVAGFDVCTAGVCGCGTDDAKCAASASGTQCVSNHCGCVTDDDCTVDGEADACFSGTCGCSGDAVCTEAGQECLPFATFDASDVD